MITNRNPLQCASRGSACPAPDPSQPDPSYPTPRQCLDPAAIQLVCLSPPHPSPGHFPLPPLRFPPVPRPAHPLRLPADRAAGWHRPSPIRRGQRHGSGDAVVGNQRPSPDREAGIRENPEPGLRRFASVLRRTFDVASGRGLDKHDRRSQTCACNEARPASRDGPERRPATG